MNAVRRWPKRLRLPRLRGRARHAKEARRAWMDRSAATSAIRGATAAPVPMRPTDEAVEDQTLGLVWLPARPTSRVIDASTTAPSLVACERRHHYLVSKRRDGHSDDLPGGRVPEAIFDRMNESVFVRAGIRLRLPRRLVLANARRFVDLGSAKCCTRLRVLSLGTLKTVLAPPSTVAATGIRVRTRMWVSATSIILPSSIGPSTPRCRNARYERVSKAACRH